MENYQASIALTLTSTTDHIKVKTKDDHGNVIDSAVSLSDVVFSMGIIEEEDQMIEVPEEIELAFASKIECQQIDGNATDTLLLEVESMPEASIATCDTSLPVDLYEMHTKIQNAKQQYQPLVEYLTMIGFKNVVLREQLVMENF